MSIPPYVVNLRTRIGHELLWLPGATAVVFDDSDRVLLVRRSDNGQWAPVTGIVDPGEHPAEAAVRECLEETGVECAVERLVWVGVTPPQVHLNGDHAQYLDHTFRCRFLAGRPHPADEESTDARWWPYAALPPMKPVLQERIRMAHDHQGDVRLD